MIDLKKDFGAEFDNVTDDTQSWLDAFAAAKATGETIIAPPGRSVVTDTIPFTTNGTSDFLQGPRLIGAGGWATKIVAKNMSGKPIIDLAGLPNKRLAGAMISGIGFEQEGCTVVDAIRYRGVWHSSFEDLHFEDLSGSAFRAGNPNSGDTDADASAHVTIRNVRATGGFGPAFNSDGCSGGVVLHNFEQCYFVNNGQNGAGQVVLDGVGNMRFNNCSMASVDLRPVDQRPTAFAGVNVPHVKIKATHLHSQIIRFEGGEYGNNGGTHFDIDGVVNLQVQGIRQVRRVGELNSTRGFLFRSLGYWHTGIFIYPGNEVAIDHASPAFTWATREGGANFIDVNVTNPRTTSFASGNVMRSGF